MSSGVSSTEARSRSTSSTRAPSRAKRRAVARPLPSVAPGVWPAPTTRAVLPASRPVTWRSHLAEGWPAGLGLDPPRVQAAGEQGVVARQHGEVDQLLLRVAAGQHRPGRVGNAMV